MPKILDLIYRVKDEASAALKRVKREQDNAGQSSDSLRTRLKGLKAQYTELKSALSLVGIGFNLLKSIVIGSLDAYRRYADQQIAAAKAAGQMTDALRLQEAELKVHDQLIEESGASQRQLGETVSRLTTLTLAWIAIKKREGVQTQISIEMLQEEIAARTRASLVVEENREKVEGLALALKNLQPYLDNEITLQTRQLSEAEAGAKRLLAYLQEISNRRWGVNVQGTYVGPDVSNPFGTAGSGGAFAPSQPSTSSSGAPRLMGNTQADRDRYNAAYRAWRQSGGGLGSDD